MFKLKIFASVVIFSFLLVGTSIIKNKTRELEKKIHYLSKEISLKEKDYKESELDFAYLSSPKMIEKKIDHYDRNKYFPMDFSKIFLNLSNFENIKKKLITIKQVFFLRTT